MTDVGDLDVTADSNYVTDIIVSGAQDGFHTQVFGHASSTGLIEVPSWDCGVNEPSNIGTEAIFTVNPVGVSTGSVTTPTFVAAGATTETDGSGDVSVAIPSHTAGDLLVLISWSNSGGAATIGTGWRPTGTIGTDVQFEPWMAVKVGDGAETTVTYNSGGLDSAVAVFAVRNCRGIGAWNEGGNFSHTSNGDDLPTATTVDDNVLLIEGAFLVDNGLSDATLGTGTEVLSGFRDTFTDSWVVVNVVTQATAGTTATSALTHTGGTNPDTVYYARGVLLGS